MQLKRFLVTTVILFLSFTFIGYGFDVTMHQERTLISPIPMFYKYTQPILDPLWLLFTVLELAIRSPLFILTEMLNSDFLVFSWASRIIYYISLSVVIGLLLSMHTRDGRKHFLRTGKDEVASL